jgi:hypothetical protein
MLALIRNPKTSTWTPSRIAYKTWIHKFWTKVYCNLFGLQTNTIGILRRWRPYCSETSARRNITRDFKRHQYRCNNLKHRSRVIHFALSFSHYSTGGFINRLTVYCGSANLTHTNILNVIYNKAVKYNVEARHAREISSLRWTSRCAFLQQLYAL